MSSSTRSPAADAARPTVEVRDHDGRLLRAVDLADADLLHRRMLAEWVGTGHRRYLRLRTDAPYRGARTSGGTRRDRADQTCRTYDGGQPFGGPTVIEHRPT